MPRGRVQIPSTSFEGMSMLLNAPYLLQYRRILTLPICLRHQSWYLHHLTLLILSQKTSVEQARFVATGSRDKTVRLWLAQGGQPFKILVFYRPARTIAD